MHTEGKAQTRREVEDSMPILDRGFVHVYTGDGKGKTTSALGMALRMAGCGGRTAIVQFMKGWPYSEVEGLAFLSPRCASGTGPGVLLVQTGRPDYVYPEKIDPVDFAEAERGLSAAFEIVLSGEYDLVILDELNVALSFGLVPLDRIIDLLERRPPCVEIVITGRNAPREILDKADLITEMVEIRHPYQKGILARKGIDC